MTAAWIRPAMLTSRGLCYIYRGPGQASIIADTEAVWDIRQQGPLPRLVYFKHFHNFTKMGHLAPLGRQRCKAAPLSPARSTE